MSNYMIVNGQLCCTDELMHYGVKGMKWGKRKATPYRDVYKTSVKNAKKRMYDKQDKIEDGYDDNIARINRKYGQLRYNLEGKNARMDRKTNKAYNREVDDLWNKYTSDMDKTRSDYKAERKAAKEEYKNSDEYKAKRAKALKVGVAVAGTALATYGAYKLGKAIKNKNFAIATENGKKAAKEFTDRNELFSSKIDFNEAGDLRARSVTRTGNVWETSWKKGTNSSVAEAAIRKHNDVTRELAKGIADGYREQAAEDSLLDATKNVASYYYNKRKRK